ncbi:MAG: LEA type 2 family protein [Bacteroidetes bacterium]|nr:LEA type 2 family protein [Bacteroidota bacterium]
MKDPLVKIGILGAMAFAAYKFFPQAKKIIKAAATGGKLNVSVSGLQFKKPFSIQFRVINPTDGELSVKAIAGDILANGNTVATFVKTEEIKITPNSQQIVNVELKVSAFNALSFLPIVSSIVALKGDRAAILQYVKSISLKIEGTVNAAGIPITINQNIYN